MEIVSQLLDHSERSSGVKTGNALVSGEASWSLPDGLELLGIEIGEYPIFENVRGC